MSSDIQILLLSETAGFPGREMKDLIQVFPADCMMTRTIVINASTQCLYRALKPKPLCSMLPWPWLLTAKIHTWLATRQPSHFWGRFLCTSYIRRMIICITGQMNSLSVLWKCRLKAQHLGGFMWQQNKAMSENLLFVRQQGSHTFFFINSGQIIQCHVLLYLWWQTKCIAGKLKQGHKIIEWFVLEGTFEDHLILTPLPHTKKWYDWEIS